jgi:hypothetical protein
MCWLWFFYGNSLAFLDSTSCEVVGGSLHDLRSQEGDWMKDCKICVEAERKNRNQDNAFASRQDRKRLFRDRREA